MKVIDLKNIEGTERDKLPTGCRSVRFLLESDNMGFSVNKTIIPKGGPHHWHYPHHVEACYCIAGHGILTEYATGNKYDIFPDTLYALTGDDHSFEAIEDTVLISIFNPPLNGMEVHDENGHYPQSEGLKKRAEEIVHVCNESGDNYEAVEQVMELI
ncbi:MAG: ectoine synthase [Candidatus Kariarchaeaceae archaeon]|jgi:L-ectoine synthase